jgi:ferredoxin
MLKSTQSFLRASVRSHHHHYFSGGGSGSCYCRSSSSSSSSSSVSFTVELEDDTVQRLAVPAGTTLLEALDSADFSDQWEGGACGGGCACSTCRVVVVGAPWRALLPAPEDDERDILEDGADQAAAAARQEAASAGLGGEEGRAAGAAAAAAYLDGARLSCQLELTAETDGIVLRVPESMYNLIEIPLHMRPR